MVSRLIVTTTQEGRANRGMAPGGPRQLSQASFYSPPQPDTCLDWKAAGLAHRVYGIETASTENGNETGFFEFGQSGRSISMPSDTTNINLDGQPLLIANASMAAEGFEMEQDNLASARGLLLALALSVPIWIILFFGSMYLAS
jgi:hypothetical protein